jgi:uncharacterized protein
MQFPPYAPPAFLKNGLAMTIDTVFRYEEIWKETIPYPEPEYRETIFQGKDGVGLYGWVACPPNPKGTIVGTYGITGDLEGSWYLRILGCQALAMGYAVVLFDWRAHGKTAELSSVLTSDGLNEGEDFVRIAAKAKTLGCSAPFWFTGYSLGGQLALWGVKIAQDMEERGQLAALGLEAGELGGGAVICPNLDSYRSLNYLIRQPLGKYLEKAIAKELKKLAWQLHKLHPGAFDPKAIERANSILGFDHELVIGRLGFSSVEEYYTASSPLLLLSEFKKPTLIIYAEDDPMFLPALVGELEAIGSQNRAIDLLMTPHGGHVGYVSSKTGQKAAEDPHRWWVWNRVLQWCDGQV